VTLAESGELREWLGSFVGLLKQADEILNTKRDECIRNEQALRCPPRDGRSEAEWLEWMQQAADVSAVRSRIRSAIKALEETDKEVERYRDKCAERLTEKVA